MTGVFIGHRGILHCIYNVKCPCYNYSIYDYLHREFHEVHEKQVTNKKNNTVTTHDLENGIAAGSTALNDMNVLCCKGLA